MVFRNISPRFRARGPSRGPQTKEAVLAAGEWIDDSLALKLKITDDERLAAWLVRKIHWLVPHDSRRAVENVYRDFALHLHAHGWSAFPETRDDRKPAAQEAWNKGKLSRFQVRPSERRDSLIPVSHLFSDVKGTGGNNAAIVCGPASGHIRAWDIDCLDEDHARAVTEVALRVFGDTPFRRVGRAPKIMLLYRVEGDDIALPTRTVTFLTTDGEPDLILRDGSWIARNMVEFLGAGHNFTAYGLHHGTGRSFDWSQGSLHPAIAGPDHAPVINRRQIKQFYKEIAELRPLAGFGASSSPSPIGGAAEVSKFHRFRTNTTSGNNPDVWLPERSRGEWILGDQDWVIDGREKYLTAACWATLSANIGLVANSGSQKLLYMYYEQHCVSNIYQDAKWSEEKIRRACKAKFNYALPKWEESFRHFQATGRYLPKATPIRLREDGTALIAQHIAGSERPEDGSLDWLPEQAGVIPALAGTQRARAIAKIPKPAERVAADKGKRALVPTLEERLAIQASIADQVYAGVDAFFADAQRALIGGIEGDVPVHIVKAPTGAGKTTTTVKRILELGPRGPGQGQVFVLLPSHNNIDESLLTAARVGMTVPETEFDEDAAIAELDEFGVRAERFMGKKRAGCQRSEEMELLTSKGIGAAGLCGSTIDDEDDEFIKKIKKAKGEKIEKKEVLCPFRERGECEYWHQMGAVAAADVVFLPHAFLTMGSLPKILKNARAIIIDESVAYQVLRQARMDLDVLKTPRKQPFITKAEMAEHEGRTAEDIGTTMQNQRTEVAGIALDAIMAGECPAAAIRDAGQSALVQTTLKVVKRAHVDEREINPTMDMSAIGELARRPKGKALIEEERFWKIIAERIEALEAGTAKGAIDVRLQKVFVTTDGKEKPFVRMSWRAQTNWPTTPKLLLDASADAGIVRKIFGTEPVVHEIEAPLHLHTILIRDRPFANRAFIPDGESTKAEQELALATVEKTRAMITKAAGAYSYGRVLMGSTIAVRETLAHSAWTPPENVDQVHFGALRGLDFAKHHSVAISVGRSEQPIHIVDGYAAALTYDDPSPEPPYDVMGNGCTPNGKPLFRTGQVRRLEMRTGEDYEDEVPMMSGNWARTLEKGWREEELRQFVGRLRPVYRGGVSVEGQSDEVPVWICQSKTIPEGFIIDEIITLDDMAADVEFYDVLRLSEGVLADGITGKLQACRHLGDQRLSSWMKTALPDVPKLGERLISSMHCVRYRLAASDEILVARIAAWHDDPVAALRQAAAFATVEISEIVEVEMSERKRVTAAMPRAHDRIDQALAEAAPFRDPRMLLQSREEQLSKAFERISAAGSRLTREELEWRWRRGEILEDIVDFEVEEYERSKWVRMYDGEEIYEIMPHWFDVA